MATATIKKIVGYQAPDGTTHATEKAAIEYTQASLVRAALEAAFPEGCLETGDAGVSEDDRGNPVISAFGLGVAEWLLANKDKIEAAFKSDVQVRLRAKRGSKKAAAPATPATPTTGV